MLDLIEAFPNEILHKILSLMNPDIDDIHTMFAISKWRQFLTKSIKVVTNETFDIVINKYPSFPLSIFIDIHDFDPFETDAFHIIYYVKSVLDSECRDLIEQNNSIEYSISTGDQCYYDTLPEYASPLDPFVRRVPSPRRRLKTDCLKSLIVRDIKYLDLYLRHDPVSQYQFLDFVSFPVKLPSLERVLVGELWELYGCQSLHRITAPKLECLIFDAGILDMEADESKEIFESLYLQKYASKEFEINVIGGELEDVDLGIAETVRFSVNNDFTYLDDVSQTSLKLKNIYAPHVTNLELSNYHLIEFENVDLPNLRELIIRDPRPSETLRTENSKQFEFHGDETYTKLRLKNFNAPLLETLLFNRVEIINDNDVDLPKLTPYKLEMGATFYKNVRQVSQLIDFDLLETLEVPFRVDLIKEYNIRSLRFPTLANLGLLKPYRGHSAPLYGYSDLLSLKVFKAPVLEELNVCSGQLTYAHFYELIKRYPTLKVLEITEMDFPLNRSMSEFLQDVETLRIKYDSPPVKKLKLNGCVFPELQKLVILKRCGLDVTGQMKFEAPKLKHLQIDRMLFEELDISKYKQLEYADVRVNGRLIMNGLDNLETLVIKTDGPLAIECDKLPPKLKRFLYQGTVPTRPEFVEELEEQALSNKVDFHE